MKANIGKSDKIIRLVASLVLFSQYFVLEGDLRFIAFAGVIPLLTGIINWCPLYTIFGISTCKKD